MYQSRRGHAPQISISDDNHHVTEAIGDMYGDTPSPEFALRNGRPLSFVSSPLGETIQTDGNYAERFREAPGRPPLGRAGSDERGQPPVNGMNGGGKRMAREGMEGLRQDNGIPSPPMLNRNTSDTASQHFPMNLDYSKPEDVAQELSNLQAIRRMSMDVNSQDPDLPSFSPSIRVPSVAPSHGDDEEDPSRLFWVPARLHPELAPKEFKTFIEDKVKTIKRTSLSEESLLNADGVQRQASSGGSLRRKKSMLSRQIDSGANYEDGAERLERKGSLPGRGVQEPSGVGLKDLETLVNDPSQIVRKISDEAQRESMDSGIDMPTGEDAPILPAKPAGQGLKRSTRTQYRRGSTRKGDKLPFSRRIVQRQTGSDGEESPMSSPNTDIPEVPQIHLNRVQTEPVPQLSSVENFSRPGRKPRTPPPTASGYSGEGDQAAGNEERSTGQRTSPPSGRRSFHSRIASNGRTTAASIGAVPVPQIIETPPQDPSYPPQSGPVQHPERKSSRNQRSPEPPASLPPQQPLPNRPRPMQQPPRPNIPRQGPAGQQPQQQQNRTLDDMAAHPSPLPGGGATRTDALSFIPTMQDDKKPDKRKGKDETRKTSWSWGSLLGSDEKEKEKERERREREEREAPKKAPKGKPARPGESTDSTRLDVLQQSIDGGRPRESLVLDRNSLRLEEERRKESNRKSGDPKKEKDSSIFSSLFGGKKKGEKESGKKGSSSRGLSPEPPPKILKPDVDYNWTRFSIMEERAIYRMAHIKLANPRRELYSQVLLSNFMYSYLAKVQSQHPQLQVPAAQQQKRHGQGQKKDQPDEFSQYQRYQEVSF